MYEEPESRHLTLLKKLSEGFVEASSALPAGVGQQTIDECLQRVWIIEAHDEEYGVKGYAITAAGEAVLDRHHAP